MALLELEQKQVNEEVDPNVINDLMSRVAAIEVLFENVITWLEDNTGYS